MVRFMGQVISYDIFSGNGRVAVHIKTNIYSKKY